MRQKEEDLLVVKKAGANQRPRLIKEICPFKIDISGFKRRLDKQYTRTGHQPTTTRKLQRKCLYKAIVDQNVQKLIHDPLTNPFFQKVNQKHYKCRFEEYLALLFKDDTFIFMDDLKKTHAFGLASQYYVYFKMMLFRTIYTVENYYVDVPIMFDGCRRVEKMRLCITTKNEMFDQCPKPALTHELKEKFIKTGFYDPDIDMLTLILEVLFNSSGLADLAKQVQTRDLFLSCEEYVAIKAFVVKKAVNLPFMMFTALDNFRLIRPLLYQKANITDLVKVRHKTLSNFVANLLAELSKAECFSHDAGIQSKQLRAAQFMIYFLFNTSDFCFSRFEVAYIIADSALDSQFYNRFFLNLLKTVRQEQFSEDIQSNLVADFKKLRRACLKKTPKEKQIAALSELVQKCLNRVVIVWGNKQKMCQARSLAYYFYKEQLLDHEQLRKIHLEHKVTQDSYKFLEDTICDKLELDTDMASKLPAKAVRQTFQKYSESIVRIIK